MHQLLDDYLCKKYPKIFIERNLSPQESCMHWGLAVGNGWFSLLDTLCHDIQSHTDSHNDCVRKGYDWAVKAGEIPQFVALQVKEKFSGLRFYHSGGDEKIAGMVSFAEDLSYSICEECGYMNEEVGRNKKGWIQTSCKRHARNSKDFAPNGKPELAEIWRKVRQDEKEAAEKAEKEFTKERGDRNAIQLMFDKTPEV
jgi:rubrerythrin